MNRDTRKRIDAIVQDIENAAAMRVEIDQMVETLNEKISDYKEAFADVHTQIEEIRDEEQEKFDNLSEGLQQSERGQNIESAVSALDEAMSACDALDWDDVDLSFDPDDVITQLDDAKGY